MQEAKFNIKKIVAEYKRVFPEEYRVVCEGVTLKRSLNATQFAEVEGTQAGTEMRALYEISETLHTMLVRNLPIEQLTWLKVGDGRDNKGGRWFAKTFPEFRLPKYI